MIVSVVLLVPALTIAAFWVGHHVGVSRGRFDVRFESQQRLDRANGLFMAADAELNALKVQHSQTLMELENAKRDIALLTRH